MCQRQTVAASEHFFVGVWRGQNAFSEQQKLPKMTNFCYFFFWLGGQWGGEDTVGGANPWCHHWWQNSISKCITAYAHVYIKDGAHQYTLMKNSIQMEVYCSLSYFNLIGLS